MEPCQRIVIGTSCGVELLLLTLGHISLHSGIVGYFAIMVFHGRQAKLIPELSAVLAVIDDLHGGRLPLSDGLAHALDSQRV